LNEKVQKDHQYITAMRMRLFGIERRCVTNDLTALFPQNRKPLRLSSITSHARGLETIGWWRWNEVM